MKTFGCKKEFALEYELDNDLEEAQFNLYIENKSICAFKKNNIICKFKWDIRDLVEWLDTNLNCILNEEKFPLSVDAKTAFEFMENSNNFDSDDDDEFDRWYEVRQDWIFQHSWYSSRAGGYLADIYFFRVGDEIEVSWNNANLYHNIEFLNPTGIYYIKAIVFKDIITKFINSFKSDINLN